jgi:hypothetical protein
MGCARKALKRRTRSQTLHIPLLQHLCSITARTAWISPISHLKETTTREPARRKLKKEWLASLRRKSFQPRHHPTRSKPRASRQEASDRFGRQASFVPSAQVQLVRTPHRLLLAARCCTRRSKPNAVTCKNGRSVGGQRACRLRRWVLLLLLLGSRVCIGCLLNKAERRCG